MVGMERSILPMLAREVFGLEAQMAILSFIVAFGLSKAAANYMMGKLAKTYGRKKLLLLGWLFALPVPFLLMYAPDWSWVVFANVLLGIHQGFAWSSTVIMKIDLVGDKDRGLAMGINEFAGYLAVGLVAYATSWVASEYGLYPYPFYLGVFLSLAGLLLSVLFLRDTQEYVHLESKENHRPVLQGLFWETSIRHPQLGSVTQAGLVNNMNDGMIWGILPMVLAAKHFSLQELGLVVGVYPAVWGIGQLFTGKMADHYSKKKMLFGGMLMQAMAITVFGWSSTFVLQLVAAFFLGLGTALVYPTFLVVIAENVHPQQRAESIGVFRLWRDSGYAIGALLTGVIADSLGVLSAIYFIAGITFLSAMYIFFRMKGEG
ncbi:MAG TPA: MFS transporter [Phaeodactylibacter sp.]|nr:MFS transporter [Phaeodactylibacter sp.]